MPKTRQSSEGIITNNGQSVRPQEFLQLVIGVHSVNWSSLEWQELFYSYNLLAPSTARPEKNEADLHYWVPWLHHRFDLPTWCKKTFINQLLTANASCFFFPCQDLNHDKFKENCFSLRMPMRSLNLLWLSLVVWLLKTGCLHTLLFVKTLHNQVQETSWLWL